MLPSDFMDNTSLCIFYNFMNERCLFCGMTRAFIHLIHLEIGIAYKFNNLVFIIFPTVCLLVLYDFKGLMKRLSIKR